MKDALTGGLEQIQKKLSLPFPDNLVQTKSQGGAEIDFVPYTYYVARLNAVLPFGWSCDVPKIETVETSNGAKLLMTVAITLKGRTYTGTGVAEAAKQSWGGAHAEAFSQAFRRACMQFGMGLYMYHGENVNTLPWIEEDLVAHDIVEVEDDDGDSVDADAGDSDSGNEHPAGDGAGDRPDDDQPEEPTERQRERLKSLFSTGVYNDEELAAWRQKMKSNFTKQTAGVVIRQMKERYEEKTGEPFDPEEK